jgi:hypothetical protein
MILLLIKLKQLYYLVAGIVFIVVDVLISLKNIRKWKELRGREKAKTVLMLIIGAIFIVLIVVLLLIILFN